MKKKFQHQDAVAGEVTFEGTNVLEAVFPNVLRDEGRGNLLFRQELRMHPDHKRFLVIAPVENADVASIGQASHAAPEKVVVQILGGRRLERKDLASLRVNPG